MTSAPSAYLFLKMPVFGAQNKDFQLVSGTHKKLAEFCQKCNITRHSFECLREYQPVLVMPKKLAEMRRNGKNLRKHNKSMKCSKNTAICRKSPILILPFDLSEMVL